jgi:uncharacterized membrane protein YozB (DUF420 family)
MDSDDTRRGLGIPSVLFLIFLVLKLTDNVKWSWWWVASPLWIYLAFIAFVVYVDTGDK